MIEQFVFRYMKLDKLLRLFFFLQYRKRKLLWWLITNQEMWDDVPKTFFTGEWGGDNRRPMVWARRFSTFARIKTLHYT